MEQLALFHPPQDEVVKNQFENPFTLRAALQDEAAASRRAKMDVAIPINGGRKKSRAEAQKNQ
jgi:hypothetical protein